MRAPWPFTRPGTARRKSRAGGSTPARAGTGFSCSGPWSRRMGVSRRWPRARRARGRMPARTMPQATSWVGRVLRGLLYRNQGWWGRGAGNGLARRISIMRRRRRRRVRRESEREQVLRMVVVASDTPVGERKRKRGGLLLCTYFTTILSALQLGSGIASAPCIFFLFFFSITTRHGCTYVVILCI